MRFTTSFLTQPLVSAVLAFTLMVGLILVGVAAPAGATSLASADGRVVSAGQAADSVAEVGDDWFTSWAQSQDRRSGITFTEQTFRMITHLSQGGDAVRIRFQNQYGAAPITIDAAAVALSANGSATVPGTTRTLAFAGLPSVTIPVGGEVWSDTVELETAAQDDVAVSMYVKAPTVPSLHSYPYRDNYVSAAGSGDQVADESGTPFAEKMAWTYLVSAVDVHNTELLGTIVSFGSSVVDGEGSQNCGPGCTATGTNRRWSDELARRINSELPADAQLAVANAGIGGTTSAPSCAGGGNDGVSRLQRDVLALHGVTGVIFYYGTNDLGENCSSATILASYQDMFSRLRDAGIAVYVTPITPRPSYTAQQNAERNAVNAFVRNSGDCSGTCDGVLDFDEVLKDPANPNAIFRPYDTGDGTHVNVAGQQAIANSISLPLIASSALAPDDTRPLTKTFSIYDFEDGFQGWRAGTGVGAVEWADSFANGPKTPFAGNRVMDASSVALPADAFRSVFVEPPHPLDLSASTQLVAHLDAWGGLGGGTGYEAAITLTSADGEEFIETFQVSPDTWNELTLDVSSWAARGAVSRIEIGFRALGTSSIWVPHFQIDDVTWNAGPVGGPAEATSCDTAATADGQQPVLQLQLGTDSTWPGVRPNYSFDGLDAVQNGFDRVGYCLETTGGAGDQWAWAGMDPFTADASLLGLHTIPGQISQQRVTDLEVASNVAGVATGEHLTGWLEHWPNSYLTHRSGQVEGATSERYDADDQPITGWHGSFQIHQVNEEPGTAGAPSTVMALNNFTGPGTLALGFGDAPRGGPAQSDWTFAANANAFTSRTLTVFARPAVVSLTQAPQDRQLFARDTDNGANVVIAGEADASVDSVRMSSTSQGETVQQVGSGPSFSFDTRITAGLHDYDFLLEARVDGGWREVGHWTHIVSGDVFVIQGQSNAESAAWESGSDSSTGNQSPWVRTYGTTSWNSDTSRANRAWQYAYGDMTSPNKGEVTNAGMVGQWGMRMGGVLSQQLEVPIAIFNGAHGGQRIGFFQRNDADPNDANTNYGRLRQRLEAAGVLADVKAVLWYQGQAENGDTRTHIEGFTSLLEDWRGELGSDLTDGSLYYAFQIRGSCSPAGDAAREGDIDLRNAQRNLSRTLGVTVLSTTGAPNHDGCHFGYENGYKMLGEQAAAVLSRDVYEGPSAGVAAPDPIAASAASASSTEFTIQLDSATDPLTVDAGIDSTGDFVLHNSAASVTNVTYVDGGKLLVTVAGSIGAEATVSYLSHYGPGPMLRTSRGVGLLAFDRLPVVVGGAPPQLVDSVPEAVAGGEYSTTLGAVGTDAARYTVTHGILPTGFALDRVTGELTGTSTVADATTFTVRMDSAAGTSSREFSLIVAPAPVAELTVSSDSITSTVRRSVQISVTGEDAFGNDLGDLVAEAVLTSDKPNDVFSGSRVTFTHAGAHVITATVGEVSGSVRIDVRGRGRWFR